jgi:hypothetical protein
VATPPPQRLLDLARGDVGRRIAEARRNGTVRSIAAEVQRTHGLSPRNWRTLQEYAEEAHPAGAQEAQPAVAVVADGTQGAPAEVQRSANREPAELAAPSPPVRSGDSGRAPAFSIPPSLRFADDPDILVIPDAHAEHGQNLWRFAALGRMIRDLQPRIVVCLGDWTSNDALSRYDRGTAKGEKRRWIHDRDAGRAALDLMETHARSGQGWTGRKVLTLGNHDVYPERYANEHPEMEGALSSEDIGFRQAGWEVFQFLKDVAVIEGIAFCHYFEKPGTPRAIGGVNLARSMLLELHESTIAGHNHGYHYSQTTTGTGRRIHALVAGIYSEHDADYQGAVGNARVWRGAFTLHGCDGRGDFTHRGWALDDIRKRWGG